MSKRTLFSTAELKRMAQVANDEGVTVEMERDGTIVRVMPFHPAWGSMTFNIPLKSARRLSKIDKLAVRGASKISK